MTSTVQDRNRFEPYLDLFNGTYEPGIKVDGEKKIPDRRVSLYLHWLTSRMTIPPFRDQVKLPKKAIELIKQKHYDISDSNKNKPEEISSEWIRAYEDWGLKPKNDKGTGSKAVETVKKLASSQLHNNLRGKMVRIVEEHYTVKDGDNKPLGYKNWGEAKTLVVKNNPLYNYLKGNGMIDGSDRIKSSVKTANNENLKNFIVDGQLVFSLKMDKNLMKVYFDGMVELHKNAESTGDSDFFDVDTSVKEHVFYRKMDDTSKLYMKDEDGNEVEVQRGSKYHINLQKGSNCFNIGFKGDNSTDCSRLITECLAGRDINKCKEFMKSANYWKDAKDSVKDMLPGMAVDLLKGFGFEVIKTTDSNGNNVNAMESVESWSGKLKNHLNTGELKEVLGNTQLMGYLKMVVQRVNDNPAILNPNITVDGKVNTVDKNNYFVRMGLGRKEPEKSRTANYVPLMRERNKSLLSIRQIINSLLKPYGLVKGVGLGALRPLGGIAMVGGTSAPVAEYFEDLKSPESEQFKVSEIAETALESLYTRLSQNGKDLDQNDKQTIEKLVKDLKNTEEKLFKAVIYLDKYVNLKEALGNNNMGSNDNVTLSKMKEYVDKHMDKTNLKQNNIISVLERFVNAVEEASTTNETKQQKGTLPKSY